MPIKATTTRHTNPCKAHDQRWIGTISVLLAASLWATTGIAARVAYAVDVSPLLLTAARINVTWAMLGGYLLVMSRPLLRVQVRDLPHLALFGIIGIGLTQFTYLFTMTQTNVGIAVLLQSLSPAFIYLYSLLRRTEPFRPAKLGVLLLALLGGTIVAVGQGGWGGAVSPLGLVTGLASAVCWAFYAIRAKPFLDRYSQWTLLFWGSGFASIGWWIWLSPWQMGKALAAEPTFLVSVLYLAVFCTLIPSGLYLNGIRLLLPSTAGILAASEPVVASTLAYVLLGETLTPLQLAGGGLIVVALTKLQSADVQEASTRYAAKDAAAETVS